MSQLTRRTLLKAGAATVVGTAAGGALGAGVGNAAEPRFAGHKPGKIYLGQSTGGSFTAAMNSTGPVGLYRSFHQWSGNGEQQTIDRDHAAGRIPWISFKPPNGSSSWKAIGSGQLDADIRARARRHATGTKPVIVTFNHEPQTDPGNPADFAAAWVRIHDVMQQETGLKNVAFAPIIGDWVFNPKNRQHDPEQYLTAAVLSRMKLLGIDIYQNPSGETYVPRLGRILSWLDGRGYPLTNIAVGETGCSNYYRNTTAVAWWNASWSYAVQRADRISAISYFNSERNSRSGVNWALTESSAKLAAYKAALASSVATRL